MANGPWAKISVDDSADKPDALYNSDKPDGSDNSDKVAVPAFALPGLQREADRRNLTRCARDELTTIAPVAGLRGWHGPKATGVTYGAATIAPLRQGGA